MKTQRIN